MSARAWRSVKYLPSIPAGRAPDCDVRLSAFVAPPASRLVAVEYALPLHIRVDVALSEPQRQANVAPDDAPSRREVGRVSHVPDCVFVVDRDGHVGPVPPTIARASSSSRGGECETVAVARPFQSNTPLPRSSGSLPRSMSPATVFQGLNPDCRASARARAGASVCASGRLKYQRRSGSYLSAVKV
jgi:hypothetical protein